MELTPNTITLTTLDGTESVTLLFMGVMKGNAGEKGESGDPGDPGTDASFDAAAKRIPIRDWDTEERYAIADDEFYLIRGDYETDQTFRLAEIPEDENVVKLHTGSYMSLRQKGVGRITIVPDEDVTLVCPAGYLPSTRAQGSTISLVCESEDTNEWMVSGDLTIEEFE